MINKLKTYKQLKVIINWLHLFAWIAGIVGFVCLIYDGYPWYMIHFAAIYLVRIGLTGDTCPYVFIGNKIDNKIKELS